MIDRKDVAGIIGNPFVAEKDGYAWGCLAPMYEILPETLHYRYPISEDKNMLQYFKKFCKEIELKDVKYGDILVIKLPKNQWHLMVCLGDGKGVHCTGHIDTEIVPITVYERRIKGVFRYE